ncbi:MAG: arylsulfatase [Gammaproteobacteria bacterium]|nr:arylsulfatase [Gammaproteobacteria bacterium]
MTRTARSVFLLLSLTMVVFGPAPQGWAEEARKPNIVFILVDNLGYGDIGAYGGGELRGAPTPNIDQLAAEGLRLTNFNVEPECIPSRSALMTGRMPIRSGLDGPVAKPGNGTGLSPWEVTLPELLKLAGYRTAMYGKWHLGEQNGRLPNDQGFDEWWGFPKSSGETLRELQPGWTPEVSPNQPLLEGRAGQSSHRVGVYDLAMRPLMDEMITERSVAYIREQAGSKQPFFLYVPFSLPHSPPLPNPKFADKSKTDYQNALREIDANTGAILDVLASTGIADDTIVVWASDNGPETLQGIGVQYGAQADSGPFRGEFPSAWEGAIRTPAIIRWPGRIPANRTSNEMVSITDFYATFARMAGVESSIPRDRAIDSVDQTDLFLGQATQSKRDHVMFFYDHTLLALKWRNMKVHFQVRNPADGTVRAAGQGVVNGYAMSLNYPWVFNLENDPKELWNLGGTSEWIGPPVAQIQSRYFRSLAQFPNLQPGQVKPAQPQ